MNSNTEKKILKACKNINLPGSNGVMPIAGYYGPHRPVPVNGIMTVDTMNEETFQMIADAGINLIVYNECKYTDCADEVKEGLALAEKYNIGVLVWDDRIKNDTTDAEMQEYVKDYAHYKSFAGLRVTDEPSAEYFPDVSVAGWEHIPERRLLSLFANASKTINSYDNMIGYTNLLPWSDYMKCPLVNYEQYVREFCETYKPKFISMDYYVANGSHSDDKDAIAHNYRQYFECLSVVYKCSEDYNIPLWGFVQAGGNWFCGGGEPITYLPNQAETLWLVNTLLALGAKAIQYYPLLQTQGSSYRPDHITMDTERGGLIAPDGLPSRYWFYARTANKQVAVVDEILLECQSKGMITTGYADMVTKGTYGYFEEKSYKELINVESLGERGAFIGCFDYHGKTALYVVNNDILEGQQINLTFDKEYTYKMLTLGCNKTVTSDKCELSLAAGAAMLIVIE